MAFTDEQLQNELQSLGISRAETINRQKEAGLQNVARRRALVNKEVDTSDTLFQRVKTALGNRVKEFGETLEFQKEQGPAAFIPGTPQFMEAGLRNVGDVAGSIGDVIGAITDPVVRKIAEKEWAKPAFEKLAQGMQAYESWKSQSPENERVGEMIESVVNITDVVIGAKGAKSVGKNAIKRTFDATKPLTERIATVRSAIGATEVPALSAQKNIISDTIKNFAENPNVTGAIGATEVPALSAQKNIISDTIKNFAENPNVTGAIGATEVPALSAQKNIISDTIKNFAENPNVTGAIDDIKIMVGLPESSPAVDLTFRAVKPRITKDKNLRRVKAQMELANQTIIENGFIPKSIKEYADAIYDSKKSVWDEISKQLEFGSAAGKQIDLSTIASEILDRASDPALERINPRAADQLVKISEDLVRNGNSVSILEAERMKQLLNAELSGAFGELDISKHAKEAKKLITQQIGVQLDTVLSEIPGEFQALKNKYGALSSIEDDVLKRAIVFERQNPEGLIDMITKTQAAAELVFGNAKSRAQAVARLTIGKQIKKANDANELIKRAFGKLTTKD